MFEGTIDHADRIIVRLDRMCSEPRDSLPPSVLVTEAEFRGWYRDVYQAINSRYGSGSTQLARWTEATAEAQGDVCASLRERPDEFVRAYIGHLNAARGFLVALQDESKLQQQQLLDGTKVTLPWLFENLTLSVWATLLTVIVGAFTAGNFICRSGILQRIFQN